MDIKQILVLLKQKIGVIVLMGLLVSSVSFLVLVVKEKNFKVGTDYLIVQNQNQSGPQDPYSLVKLADYNGKLFTEAIYSEIFIDQVVKTGKMNSEFLPFNKKDKLKTWSEVVNVKQNPDVGILSVTVFDNNSVQASNVAGAIKEVLTKENFMFRGDGQNIDIRVLTGPVEEKNPSVTSIAFAIAGGLGLGILLASLWIVWKDDQKRKRFAADFLSEEEYLESVKYIK
jgi:capsular polysaccharide biosynthesis protein